MSTRNPQLFAALMTPDEAVNMPEGRQRNFSFAAAVTALEVGESASRVHTPNEHLTLKQMREGIREGKERVRNNCTSAVTAAKKRTGGTYTIEVSETFTPGGNFYLIGIITRTE